MTGTSSFKLSLMVCVFSYALTVNSSDNPDQEQHQQLIKNLGNKHNAKHNRPIKRNTEDDFFPGKVEIRNYHYDEHNHKKQKDLSRKYVINGNLVGDSQFPMSPFCDKWCRYLSDNSLWCYGERSYSGDALTPKLPDLLECTKHMHQESEYPFSFNFQNFNFGIIRNDTFSKIKHDVAAVVMRECNITKLEPNVFAGLLALEFLDIHDTTEDKMGISQLSYDIFHQCPNVVVLCLGKVRDVDINTFVALPNLSEMYVTHKSLLKFENAIGKIRYLKFLSLESLGLRKIPSFIPSMTPWISTLVFDNNLLTNLSFNAPIRLIGAFTISAKNNTITKITRTEMAQFKRTAPISLNLAKNDVRQTDSDFLEDIKNLEELNLEQNVNFKNRNFFNLLGNIKRKAIVIGSLNLIACGISIGKLDASILMPLERSNIQMLFLGYNIIDIIKANAFEPVKDLKVLEISNFMQISSGCFTPLHQLKTLSIDGMLIRYHEQQPDTINLNELTTLDELQMTGIDPLHAFFQFDKLSLDILTLYNMYEFFDFYSDQLYRLLRDRKSYLKIELPGNLLFRYTDNALCSMFSNIVSEELDLSQNYFGHLPTCMFNNSNITCLLLRFNRITHIQSGLFENVNNLQFVALEYNAIQFIDEKAFTHLHPFYSIVYHSAVTLLNNSLPCNCEMEPFRKWVLGLPPSDQGTTIILDKYCKGPAWRTHEEILKVNIPWIECNRDLFIKICISSGCTVTLVIVIAIALLKYYWKDIKYRQMVHRAKKHNGYIPLDQTNEAIYDAFVSYHPEKRIWVQDVMRVELEKGDLEFTLMYDINIFPSGRESYFSGIFSHMDRSRHVIFLVTRGWMKEGMNEFEMEAAIDLLKQTKRHTLIVIMMENIPQKQMSETLRMMVRNNICLKWSENEREQRKFWRDLKLELGKKKYMN